MKSALLILLYKLSDIQITDITCCQQHQTKEYSPMLTLSASELGQTHSPSGDRLDYPIDKKAIDLPC